MTFILLARFHNYGINIQLDVLERMDLAFLMELIICMDNLKPEDINIDAMRLALGGLA